MSERGIRYLQGESEPNTDKRNKKIMHTEYIIEQQVHQKQYKHLYSVHIAFVFKLKKRIRS